MHSEIYLTTQKPNPKSVAYYCPQSLFYILFSPLMEDRLDRYLAEKVGKKYLTFYEGRNGIYHILKYLKKNFGSTRSFLPTEISPENSYSVIVACNKAGYEIVYYTGTPRGLKKNDVVILLDSSIRLPEYVFSIQDNARNALMPAKRYDFTLYSFAIGKPIPGPRGGVVVVNKKRVDGFLKVGRLLVAPDPFTETKSYLRYLLFYKIKNYQLLRRLMHWELLFRYVKGNDFTHEIIVNDNYSMCSVSKKIVSVLLK